MFELWVPITVAAAFLQDLRSALQKHLKARLSTTGATFARFGYAFPFAIAYVWFLHLAFGLPWPEPNTAFILFGILGGLAQIGATQLLVHLFSLRNFAVGTTYSKTEPIQAAVFGIVILGDPLSAGAVIAILVSLVGVMVISVAKQDLSWRNLLVSMTDKPALIGIASGGLFGISAVAYRASSLSLGADEPLMPAAFTLSCVTVFQTVLMIVFMRMKEPGQLMEVIKAWRVAGLVGLSGMAASAGWFTAMTIQNAAYVRALAQVELVFTFVASVFFFRRRRR